MTPSPVVALNRAVAIARVHGPQAGLDALGPPAVRGPLRSYHLFHVVRASLIGELGRIEETLAGLREADALASLPAEKEFIAERIEECLRRRPSGSGSRDAGTSTHAIPDDRGSAAGSTRRWRV